MREEPRLIPAHAGKTKALEVSLRRCGAHPRSRGENTHIGEAAHRAPGSSPLTRGKLCLGRPAHALIGLIPAHAGKTGILGRGRITLRAHPRSRGENSQRSSFLCFGAGSSPLTRGKRDMLWQQAGRTGLIPAHAGKTKGKAIVSFDPGAHPRSRGENRRERFERGHEMGSSPLTRGKLAVLVGQWIRRRLIPAHAGKTSSSPAQTK